MNNSPITSVSVPPPHPSRSSLACRRVAAAQVLGRRFGLGLALASITVSHAFAQAGGGKDPATILNNVLKIITGTMGTALAALGIIACGLAWMFGRASLGMITGVVGGIMIVFGASYIANQLVGAG